MVVEDALGAVAEQSVEGSGADLRLRGRIVLAGPHPSDGTLVAWYDVDVWAATEGSPPEVLVGDHDPLRPTYTSGTESRARSTPDSPLPTPDRPVHAVPPPPARAAASTCRRQQPSSAPAVVSA